MNNIKYKKDKYQGAFMGKRPHKTLATVKILKVEKMHQMVHNECYDQKSLWMLRLGKSFL